MEKRLSIVNTGEIQQNGKEKPQVSSRKNRKRVFLSKDGIIRFVQLKPKIYRKRDKKQLSTHYKIHAGHYLSDKKFSYLGTIRVTADVKPKQT